VRRQKGFVSGAQGLVASAGVTAKSVFAFAQSGVCCNLFIPHNIFFSGKVFGEVVPGANDSQSQDSSDSTISDAGRVEVLIFPARLFVHAAHSSMVQTHQSPRVIPSSLQQVSHASACTHFLNQRFSQNDIKFGFATLVLGSSELQIAALTRLFIAFKRLLEVSLPFLDPAFIEKTKSSSISFISIPRYVLRFIQCAWADACIPFVIDTIPIEASTLLGWCSIKQGPLLPNRTVPVAHGVVLSSLHRLDVGISSADISRRTRLDLQLVTCSNSSCNPQTVQHKPYKLNTQSLNLTHQYAGGKCFTGVDRGRLRLQRKWFRRATVHYE